MLPLASGLNPPKSMKSPCLALTFDEVLTLQRAFFAPVKGASWGSTGQCFRTADHLRPQPATPTSGWHLTGPAFSLPAHLGLGNGIVSGSERG